MTFLIFLRVSVSFSKNLATKKSLRIGLENFQSQKKGSVSVSKIFGLKKSLGIGLKNFGLKKSRGIGLKNFGLGNGLKEFGLPTSPNMPNMPNNEQHV